MANEFEYIRWLRQRIPSDARVSIGPGDDAAALRLTPGLETLVTTDMLMDGTDFRLTETDPRLVGRKALAVNLSDIAAMAGDPVAAVVSVALPIAGGRQLGEELFQGMAQLAEEFRTAMVGGDTNSWHGPLVLSLAVIGEAARPVKRTGARPGDWLFLTGQVGGSIRGRHLRFVPRIREAKRLAEVTEIHAMIDVSDGLAADLAHVCQESGCGAVIRADCVPLAPEAFEASGDLSPLQHGLFDGEDFELIVAVAEAAGRRLVAEQPVPGITLTHIGECVESGLWLRSEGQMLPLEPRGFVHQLE
jgi:thiamine-monophosphate kinase